MRHATIVRDTVPPLKPEYWHKAYGADGLYDRYSREICHYAGNGLAKPVPARVSQAVLLVLQAAELSWTTDTLDEKVSGLISGDEQALSELNGDLHPIGFYAAHSGGSHSVEIGQFE